MPDLIRLIKEGSRPIAPVPTGVAGAGSFPRAPRAVLFDVYGTLLTRVGDRHPIPNARRLAVESLIARYRLDADAVSLAATLRQAIAAEHTRVRATGIEHPEVRIEAIWDALFPGHPGEELRALIIEYELAVHPAWPMPGCRRLVAALKRRGTVLGIISNAQFYTPLFLEALLGESQRALGFSPSLCLYSCDFAAAKPDQRIFDAARERLRSFEIAPHETVLVGNSIVDDIVPARGNGFMTVLAALDARSFDPPRSSTETACDAVISSLSRVEALIRESDRDSPRGRT